MYKNKINDNICDNNKCKIIKITIIIINIYNNKFNVIIKIRILIKWK